MIDDCEMCDGTGSIDDGQGGEMVCPECWGAGVCTIETPPGQCPCCDGRGWLVTPGLGRALCVPCAGTGRRREAA